MLSMEVPKENSIIQNIYICMECGIECSTKSNINAHMKRKHNSFVNPAPPQTITCPMCNSRFANINELNHHVSNDHDLPVKQETLQFNSFKSFAEWKLNIERNSQSSYRVLNSRTLKDNTKIIKYVCHRSGIYTTQFAKKGIKERECKVKGSNKIGSHCPARITAKLEKGEVHVEYISTHIGHKLEVGRLRLHKMERENLAGKMLLGIPHHKILKDLGEQFNPLTRLSYTTNHDLHNIRKAYKVDSNVIFDEDDTRSVTVLIERLKNSCNLDNPIIIYKPYGTEHETIGTNNFFLIFMNSAQAEMLEKYGNNILMIDSTHGTNPYKIQLTTLMVIDEDFEGFPVAFLWSITQTEGIYKTFFSYVKEKLPELQPRIFMSDDSNTFYNGFVAVYNYFPNKVLCDWHVKRSLFDNLSKISVTEKRKEVKENIKLLINELDVLTFEKMMSNLITNLNSHEDTRKYGEYFSTYYGKRPEQWAHCFRKGFKKNTNMCLEKWHHELKYNSKTGGKCQRRLDVSIHNVLECLRLKFLRRLVTMSRNRVPYKLCELRKRHKIANQFKKKVDIFEDIPNNKWMVASSKNQQITSSSLEYYTVQRINDPEEKCQCNFTCNDCQCCLHSFSCSCHDYEIQYNMCKHIHMVCIKYASKPENILRGQQTEEDSNNWLHIDKNNNSGNNEHEFICDQLRLNTTTSIETEKKSALEKLTVLTNLINNSSNLEEISYASKGLTTIISGMSALKANKIETMIANTFDPSNKKIKLQNRRTATKTTSLKLLKRQKKRKRETKVSNEEACALNLVLGNGQ